MTRILLLSGILSLLGCASTPEYKGPTYSVGQVSTDDGSIDDSIVMAQEQAIGRIQASINQENQEPEAPKEEPGAKSVSVEVDYKLPTKESHPKVKKWIKYYSTKGRDRIQRFFNRGARYKQVIQDLLVSNGLPPDLYYLAILESGFVIDAVSHAGAVGTWQFMGPTGRQYGLKINNYVDERHDPVRSTLAAVRYLKELYRQKKSWYLALAAYNAGPGRVKRAMRRGGVRNYWTLTRRRLLPYDTREYIPQFLALLTIGKNLGKYGFEEIAKDPLKPMELVKVPSPVKLSKIAELTGVDHSEIKKLNAHLLKGMTPAGKKKHYHLWVPKENIETVKDSYAKIQQHRIKGLKVRRRYIASSRSRVRYHRVRRGQNLSSIARRYGTSVSKIKRLNGLKRSRIFVGQRLKVKGRKSYSRRSVARRSYHRVRRGENLYKIAKKYGTSVAKLKRINGMRSGKIMVGQRLKLTGKKKVLRVAKKKSRVKRYKIRRGDNLYKIARKFGMTIRGLKKLNNMKSNVVKRGQYLKIASK